jgi:hypothetical protein
MGFVRKINYANVILKIATLREHNYFSSERPWILSGVTWCQEQQFITVRTVPKFGFVADHPGRQLRRVPRNVSLDSILECLKFRISISAITPGSGV